jgi:hypothetical protein
MDRFIKIAEQKKDVPKGTIHTEALETVERLIAENKNVIICGPHGCGKSHLLNQVVNLDYVIWLDRKTDISEMRNIICIEDYDAEPLLYKAIIDQVAEHGSPTGRSIIMTASSVYMLPNFETVILKPASIEQLMTINSNERAAIRANGSIRNFLNYINDYDDVDIFQTAKEYVTGILCDTKPFIWNGTLSEHGHIWDTIHENYVDSKGVDVSRAIHGISWADVFDGVIYEGHWELLPYFIHVGIQTPKCALGKPLDPQKIRSGSSWTKFGNYKMRLRKYSEIKTKTQGKLRIEELCLLKRYAELGRYEKMLEYNLTPQDFDVMNHLAIATKLKQRDVTNIKKNLKNAIEARTRGT